MVCYFMVGTLNHISLLTAKAFSDLPSAHEKNINLLEAISYNFFERIETYYDLLERIFRILRERHEGRIPGITLLNALRGLIN